MEQEIWKDIEGYEGKYQVSNCGNVRSLMYHNAKGIKRISLLKPATDACGYFRCALSKNNILKTYKVHRLVAQAFIPNPNNYPQINHLDGNKKNNNAGNLEWCTISMNQIHAYSHNLNQGVRGKGTIVGVTYPNGDYVEYSSLKKAAQALGVHPVTIKIKIFGIKPSIKLVGYKFTLIRIRRSTYKGVYQKYGINEMGDRYE